MLEQIRKFVGSCKFWVSLEKKEIEQNGVILRYGPVVQGSIKTDDKKCEIRFDTPVPTGTKNLLLGAGITLEINHIDIEESKIVAFAGNRKFEISMKEV